MPSFGQRSSEENFLPAVVGDWALEGSVSDLNGRAVVHFGGQDGSVLGVGGWLVVVSWLGDGDSLVHNWLGDESLLDHWLGDLGDQRLDVGSWLSVLDSLVSVIDDASVVLADARGGCVDCLRDVTDGSMVRSDDVLLGCSVLVVGWRGVHMVFWLSGVDVMFWLVSVHVVLWLVSIDLVLWLVSVHVVFWLSSIDMVLGLSVVVMLLWLSGSDVSLWLRVSRFGER